MGSAGTVAVAVPDFAALGSFGDQCPRPAVNVGVGVWVIVTGPWETGRCVLRAPLTLVVPLVSRGGPRVVLTSGVTVARGACE